MGIYCLQSQALPLCEEQKKYAFAGNALCWGNWGGGDFNLTFLSALEEQTEAIQMGPLQKALCSCRTQTFSWPLGMRSLLFCLQEKK